MNLKWKIGFADDLSGCWLEANPTKDITLSVCEDYEEYGYTAWLVDYSTKRNLIDLDIKGDIVKTIEEAKDMAESMFLEYQQMLKDHE